MSRFRPSRVTVRAGALILCAALAISAALAQTSETYKVRLTPVAIDVSMMAKVAGSGALTATLAGNKLTISGGFSGLRSPATDAHIHRGLAKGVRGPAILDLHVSKQGTDTSRTNSYVAEIHDSVNLSSEELEDLRNGRLYVQVNSQGAPDGNLWGWLLR
jgi:hypothetical protein